MRLIDADKLKQHYSWWENEQQELFDSIVDAQPTADAEPVRHRKWNYLYSNGLLLEQACSECGTVFEDGEAHDFKYCPQCGARMDRE